MRGPQSRPFASAVTLYLGSRISLSQFAAKPIESAASKGAAMALLRGLLGRAASSSYTSQLKPEVMPSGYNQPSTPAA
jgi:hypothetical protein